MIGRILQNNISSNAVHSCRCFLIISHSGVDSGADVQCYTITQTNSGADVQCYTITQTNSGAEVQCYTITQTNSGADVQCYTITQTNSGADVQCYTITQTNSGADVQCYTITQINSGADVQCYTITQINSGADVQCFTVTQISSNKMLKYNIYLKQYLHFHSIKYLSKHILLLLLKEVGSARLRESDIYNISGKTPAPQYQPIDRKNINGKIVEDYSRDRAAWVNKKHIPCS